MKIQHLAIIFIIIILPISMVLSYYIGTQIDSIKVQKTYSSKLLTATYDAIKSFQLNTINNKYSSISDSKIRDIEASISTFYNSLGTELGATGYSEEDLQQFIPAILYTMYDGYYIYGKYYNDSSPVPEYNDDGSIKINPTTGGQEISYGDYQYGLRPYIYYSCRYKYGTSDFIVNYTLDNTITVYGTINGSYTTKSGALIKPDSVNESTIQLGNYSYRDSTNNLHTVEYAKYIEYDGISINMEILQEQLIILDDNNFPSMNTYEYTNYSNRRIYMDESGYFWNNKNKKQYITDIETLAYLQAMTFDGHLHSNSAAQYYYDAYEFSKWVTANLGNVTQENAVDQSGNKIEDFAITTGKSRIFELNNDNNPLIEGSTFNENRIAVIRKSIESNLSAAIANYGAGADYQFAMPIFSENDWDKLTNNISVASFMQGIPIGTKYFNDYCVITNDKNKELVKEDSIYVITSDNELHYPGCMEIEPDDVIAAYRNIDFERQTVVITEGNERYFYPHANEKSYKCMVNLSETYDINNIIDGTIKEYSIEEQDYVVNATKSAKIKNSELRRIYLTALAREKYDLYRTNNYFGK